MIENTTRFMRILDKKTVDLERFSITYSVFHGIQCFARWERKIFHEKGSNLS